jgi:CRISPR-associated protein Cmr6
MSEPVKLVRNALRDMWSNTHSAHPGLQIQRGWNIYDENDKEGKTKHIQDICRLPAPGLYEPAYKRWEKATSDKGRFLQIAMKIETRLLIGLNGGGALETGCAVSHTYGMPYIPGSSIKGAVRAFTKNLPNINKAALKQIFGSEADSEDPLGLSGSIGFHDAWWIPGKGKPFVQDILTPHHMDYYGSEGQIPATDLDSPVPNALIGVQGSFLFTLEGDPAWLKAAGELLKRALTENGIGAKTAAGYGYFSFDQKAADKQREDARKAESEQIFSPAKLKLDAGKKELVAYLDKGRKTAPVKGQEADQLLATLPEDKRGGKKIKEGTLVVEIRIKEEGNMLKLLAIRMPAQ